MTDAKFIELLKQVRVELHHRIGKEICKELDADCFDCKSRWMIGIINSWIDCLK